MRVICLVFTLILIAEFSNAQEVQYYTPSTETIVAVPDSILVAKETGGSFGLGLGLPYGGVFGLKVGLVPVPGLRLSASLGYMLIDLGFNFSVGTDFGLKSKFRPHLFLMYGVNGAIVIEGTEKYNKLYKGLSPGFGGILTFRRKTKNYLDFGFVVPIRSTEYYDDLETIQKDPSIELMESLPIAIYVGYNFKFK